MIIVVDGYNLLKTMIENRSNFQKEKQHLILTLSRYAQCKDHDLYIVFDGGLAQNPSREKNKVTVIYAGYGESADDYIKNFVVNKKNMEILLVSSDNDLIRYASQYGIYSIDAVSFASLLQYDHTSEYKKNLMGNIYKMGNKKQDDEIDRVMVEESETIHKKNENEIERIRGRSSRTLKKFEKKWLKIIKKL